VHGGEFYENDRDQDKMDIDEGNFSGPEGEGQAQSRRPTMKVSDALMGDDELDFND